MSYLQKNSMAKAIEQSTDTNICEGRQTLVEFHRLLDLLNPDTDIHTIGEQVIGEQATGEKNKQLANGGNQETKVESTPHP